MKTAAPLARLPESLGLAVQAAVVLGTFFGLVDGVVAAVNTSAHLEPASLVGCLTATAFEYTALAFPVLGVFALVFHPALGRWSPLARAQAYYALGLSAGFFAELYWWTRPFVFYGQSSFSAPRLLATLGMLAVALVLARFVARPLAVFVQARIWILWPTSLFLAGGATYLLMQRDPLSGHGVPNERTRDVPNVLLVVVDAMRQDALGCYGNTRVKTPHIDALARDGVVFENAFTQAPFTWTSFGSMLTGKYPRRHGLVKMAAGTRMVENVTIAAHLEGARLRDGRQLEDADFLSASFHTGTLSTGSGLLQGFDLYYEQMAGHGLVVAESAWSVFRSDVLLHLLGAKLAQKTGGDVAGTSRQWFAEKGQKRFSAMVHLYSTHTPYDPPAEFKDLYVDLHYSGPFTTFYAYHREAIERGDVKPTPSDVKQIQDLYYAGVTQADAAIGAILAELERQGTLDDTLVIVTSDHGESLGELDLWEHNHMVNTNLRIPLVMRLPRGIPAGKRVSAIVDEIDVFPTVCDLLGLELPAVEDDYARVDGTSLLPLVRGEVESVREFSFAENAIFASIQDRKWKLLVPFALICGDGWEKGEKAHGIGPVLLDLVNDPGETKNVLAANVEEARRLSAALCTWFQAMPEIRIEHSQRDFEAEQRLKDLGYTEGGIGIDEPASEPKR